jgi:hypothetical protein
MAHDDAVAALAEVAAEQQRLLLGPDLQRRAFRRPDGCVLARRSGRPDAQDHPVQQRQPQPARDLDHARVGEELGEVAAHRARRRGVRRAEVAEQHRGRRRASVRMARLGRETHRVIGAASGLAPPARLKT